ncbi:MAG: caspase family protein [Verrucomicrobiaceae bacterium]|nr:MAG: caspase family protein [Verrucomicrobiaceae bacterium]
MTPSAALLTITCSVYEKLSDLNCTLADGKVIRESLLAQGGYSEACAWQIDSPTKQELEMFLLGKLTELRGIDILTVFFSGHGGVANGSYYLCLRDYSPSSPSLTGFPVSLIVRFAVEMGVSILNIVIDACHSGQAQADLRDALERPAMSEDPSICVSVLASSLADQSSFTGNPYSYFTTKLNDFIVGNHTVQSKKAWVSLADIASVMVHNYQDGNLGQNVVQASLNVLGPAPFCINPLLVSSEQQPHSPLLSPKSNLGKQVHRLKDTLARIHGDLPRQLEDLSLIQALGKIAESAGEMHGELASLFEHYGEWFAEEARKQNDWSLPVRIAGSIATASLGVSNPSPELRSSIRRIVKESIDQDFDFFVHHFEDWIQATSGLSARGGGPDEFYQLPIRITAYYGRLGLIMLAHKIGVITCEGLSDVVERVCDLLTEKFGLCHVILNEKQAFYLVPFFQGCAQVGLQNLAERVFGFFFCDHFLCGGAVLRENATSEQIWSYLQARSKNEQKIDCGGIANPNEVLPILLYGAYLNGFGDLVDESLAEFSGGSANLTLVANTASFRKPVIDDAMNCTLTIGQDVYSTEEFFRSIVEFSDGSFPLGNSWNDTSFYCAVAGHLLGDRVALVGDASPPVGI